MEKSGLKEFTRPIYKYSLIAAAIIEIISLAIIGWNLRFLYGLALGTCVSIVNLSFLTFTVNRTFERRGLVWAILGYILRLCIYGGSFLISYKLGTASGIGTLLGFMTTKLGMYYTYGFKPKFNESAAKGKRLNDLDKDPWAEETQGNRHWYSGIVDTFKSMDDLDGNDNDNNNNNNNKE